MTTHYIIFIKDHDLKLKASYRGGTFFRIERTSGKMTDLILDKFGIIVPLKETEIKTYRQRYEKHITYTAIESKKASTPILPMPGSVSMRITKRSRPSLLLKMDRHLKGSLFTSRRFPAQKRKRWNCGG